jgi:pyruvate dehydrogenase E1 component alpha subunit
MSEMAAGYQLVTAMVDGNDIVAATEAAQRAADHVRAGQGPYFLEFHTWRWQGIFSGEMRAPEEVKLWKEERDPLRLGREHVLNRGLAGEAELDTVAAEVKALVAEWVKFAQDSPLPDPTTALDYVYADAEVMAPCHADR